MRRTMNARCPAIFVCLVGQSFLFTSQCYAVVMGTVYTTRPAIIDDLGVSLTLINSSFPGGSFSATAAPPFASQMTTLGPINFFGRVNQASVMYLDSTAAPGAPVRADLHGAPQRNPFSFSLPWQVTKQLTSRWKAVPTVLPITGVIISTGGSGGQSQPVVIELTLALIVDGDGDGGGGGGGGSLEAEISSVGYRLDAQARAAVASHFGASEFEMQMLRELGPSVATMGFPGEILVAEVGQTFVGAGQITSYQLGVLDNNAATDDLSFYIQAIVGTPNAVPGVDPEADEFWVAFDSTEFVPEPSAIALFGGAALACGALRRRRLDLPTR